MVVLRQKIDVIKIMDHAGITVRASYREDL